MTRSDTENPGLQKKPGKPPSDHTDANDRTPPRDGDPQQVENVPGREEHHQHGTDPDETYRTGKQGPR